MPKSHLSSATLRLLSCCLAILTCSLNLWREMRESAKTLFGYSAIDFVAMDRVLPLASDLRAHLQQRAQQGASGICASLPGVLAGWLRVCVVVDADPTRTCGRKRRLQTMAGEWLCLWKHNECCAVQCLYCEPGLLSRQDVPVLAGSDLVPRQCKVGLTSKI